MIDDGKFLHGLGDRSEACIFKFIDCVCYQKVFRCWLDPNHAAL
jgi:hypothetical protein